MDGLLCLCQRGQKGPKMKKLRWPVSVINSGSVFYILSNQGHFVVNFEFFGLNSTVLVLGSFLLKSRVHRVILVDGVSFYFHLLSRE